MQQKVIIYRTAYQLPSETFITSQLNSYRNFTPVIACRDYYQSSTTTSARIIEHTPGLWSKIRFTAFSKISGLSDLFELKNPKLVHAHFAQDGALALPIAQHLDVPLVVTCHGSDVTIRRLPRLLSGKVAAIKYEINRKKYFDKTSFFVAVSDFIAQKMLTHGFPEGKIFKHYIGVDVEYFSPEHSQFRSGSDPFILSVARHTSVKGLDILLRALSKSVKKIPELKLVQIGSGELTRELKTLTQELGIENNVIFLGSQPREVVRDYMRACTAFALTSRQTKSGAEEGFGLVLAEAAACGKPCIGTDVGGIPEVVLHGKSGLLVTQEDVEGLSCAINELVSNSALSDGLGSFARQMVVEKFNLTKQTGILEKKYSELS